MHRLIYLYILLLLLEGALRKWVLPGFSDALLLAREPVIFVAYARALMHGRFPRNSYVISGAIIVAIATVTTILFGHGNLFVTAFGIRTNFLHIPFAFIMGSHLRREDVIRIGKWWLWGSCAMTAIIAWQYVSPQSAWINRGVGGIEGAGFAGALGRYRPPGTFSFIVGVVQFYTLTAAFLLIGATQNKFYSYKLLIVSALALIISLPLSISRSLIVACFIVGCAALFVSFFQRNSLVRFSRIILFAFFGLFLASQIPLFHDGLEALSTRWERSTSEEDGGISGAIIGRVVSNMLEPFNSQPNDEPIPFLGYGIGVGTQAGAKLATGERGFNLGESEWQRMIAEYGILLGGAFCIWRISLFLKLLMMSLHSMKQGNGIPFIILSTAGYNIVSGQLGQTTVNGFVTVGIGLVIASIRERRKPSQKQGETQ